MISDIIMYLLQSVLFQITRIDRVKCDSLAARVNIYWVNESKKTIGYVYI